MRFFVVLLFLSCSAFAFNKGEGSKFEMTSAGAKTNVDIYFASAGKSKVAIEYHMSATTLLGSSVWMQFALDVSEKAGVVVQQGYFMANKNLKPEIMPRELFFTNQGVQMQQFIFSDPKELAKDLIGEEKVELPAGTISAKHYRKSNDGQVVDFWISEKVKPIGLVKLVSKSSRVASNNYTIELKSLLVNVKPAIDPKNAIPMTNNTKSFLMPKP